MDAITTGIAILGGLTGLSGLVISFRADRRATRADKRAAAADQRAVRAEEEGKRARQRELWTEAVTAAQDTVGMVATHQDVRQLLVRQRIARAELVDGLSDVHYERLGDWLSLDHVILARLLDIAISQLAGEERTVEHIEAAHRPAFDWAAASVTNLRFMRRMEPGPEVALAIEELIASAEQYQGQLNSRHPAGKEAL